MQAGIDKTWVTARAQAADRRPVEVNVPQQGGAFIGVERILELLHNLGLNGEDNRGEGDCLAIVLAELAGYANPSHAGAQRVRQEICAHFSALKSHYEDNIFALYGVDVSTYVTRIAARGVFMDCTELVGAKQAVTGLPPLVVISVNTGVPLLHNVAS